MFIKFVVTMAAEILKGTFYRNWNIFAFNEQTAFLMVSFAFFDHFVVLFGSGSLFGQFWWKS